MTSALALRDIGMSFGKTVVLRGVTLSAEQHQTHAVIGPNGAGKSTLLDIISGRTEPTSGSVLLNGRAIDGLAPHKRARLGLARSFQITSLFPNLTVLDALRTAMLLPAGIGPTPWRLLGRSSPVTVKALDLLDRLGLAATADQTAAVLAYADQRRLELGLALATDATVVLLDEPTAGLNRAETEAITALIARETQGRTLIIVEHDMQVVFALAERITVLAQGAVIATGTPEDIQANARVQEAYLGAAPVASSTNATLAAPATPSAPEHPSC